MNSIVDAKRTLEVLSPYTDRLVYPIGYRDGDCHRIVGEAISCGGTEEECRAVAELWAAAPELLAALQAFLAMPYPCVGQRMSHQSASDIQRHREVARAAIARATGQAV